MIPILNVVNFLILFPFIMAIIIGLLKKASPLRSAVIMIGGFTIMIAAVYVAVTVITL